MLPDHQVLGVHPRMLFANWWARIDRPLLYVFGALILIGIVLCTAAGPIAAMRKDIADPLHFVERQFVFLVPAVISMIICSMLSVTTARRLGVVLGAGAFAAMLLTLWIAPEIKGSTRWLSIFGASLQPSEFFKPGFIMLAAWLLAENARDPRFPGGALSFSLYLAACGILLAQPDYGQLILLTAVWGVMFFIAGWSWRWVIGLGALGAGLMTFGYTFASHFRSRIERFLDPSTGDTYQVDKSLDTIASGGLLGHDLNHANSVKESLPDAHTDFIFAVAGEEFGFVLCALIICLFAVIVFRSLRFAHAAPNIFVRCAVAGLSAQLAFQAIVNIGVSLAVIPAKGMTLPFISYGGSSLLATGITAGLLLALTRRRASELRG